MFSPPMRARRVICRLRVITAVLCCAAPLSAQQADPGRAPSWDSLAALPGVNRAEVSWLRTHQSAAEAATLFGLVARLSRPEVAQLLPSFLALDGTINFPAAFIRPLADSFAQRPPGGAPGMVRVAYLTARFRAAEAAWLEERGIAYRTEFEGNTYLPSRSAAETIKAGSSRGIELRLAFDLSPAESLLALIRTPGLTIQDAERRLSTPSFDALIRHRSQSFYPIPLSREQLAWNIVAAKSDDPLAHLYRHAHPGAFYHFGDISAHQDEYLQLLRTLSGTQRAMLDDVAAQLIPFLPDETTLSRNVALYFADQSDGWGTSDVTALDIDWFKDDYTRLLALIAHETFHAVQHALRPSREQAAFSSSAQFREGLESIFVEGTASFVAPERATPPQDRAEQARKGSALLDSLLVATFQHADSTRASALVNRGVAGAGPFYSLGAVMSKTIVDVLGTQALAGTLRGGGVAFFAAYPRARQAAPAAPGQLSPAVEQAVTQLIRSEP